MAKQNKNLLNWLIPKCSTASDILLPLNKELDSFKNYSNNPTSQIEDTKSDVNIKTVSFSKISKIMNLLRFRLILPFYRLIRKNLLLQLVFQIFAKNQTYLNTITEMGSILFRVKYVTNFLIWLKHFPRKVKFQILLKSVVQFIEMNM